MNNMNRPSNDYQLPDDSYLYDLDVDDWSMLAQPVEANKPDDNDWSMEAQSVEANKPDNNADPADKADDSSNSNLGDGHSYSLEIAALRPELEQMMLEVEYGRQKLEELERMLPETRWLLQELEERTLCQTFLDPELEQVALEAEQVRQKLDNLEQMLQGARQLLQELEESKGQSSHQMPQPDAGRESPERATSLTPKEPEETMNSQPGSHGQSKEMDQGIDWGYGMGR